MSCSSKSRFLPALRPAQPSPPEAVTGRPAAAYHLGLGDQRPSAVISSQCFQLPASKKHKEASTFTTAEGDAVRPFKAPRRQPRSLSRHEATVLPPSELPDSSQPFFSLTEQELKQLRRTMGKGPRYNGFSNITIARSLNNLGRGWDGYLQAKKKAEQECTMDEFWRKFSPELTTILSATPAQIPTGALLLEHAALAAQNNHTRCVGMLQPENVAEIQQLRLRSPLSGLHNSGLPGPPERSSFDSKSAQIPSRSTLVPETDPQVCLQGGSAPVQSSRPKRVLHRPDYRIPPPLESSPEPPSSPESPTRTPSPTPRQVYDGIQPRFVQFSCEWEGCQATLSNLETLQKHIRIVHVGVQGGSVSSCQWGGCGARLSGTAETPNGLDDHFVTTHLTPLAWRLGDGPKCHGAVAKSSSG
jgi:hypothetical protein